MLSTRQIAACLYFVNFLLALVFPDKLALFGLGWLLMTLGCLSLDASPVRARNRWWITGHALLSTGVLILFADLIQRRLFA